MERKGVRCSLSHTQHTRTHTPRVPGSPPETLSTLTIVLIIGGSVGGVVLIAFIGFGAYKMGQAGTKSPAAQPRANVPQGTQMMPQVQPEQVHPQMQPVAPVTGLPVNAPSFAAAQPQMPPQVTQQPPQGARFDPQTGKPIPKFDPMTGVQNWFD